MSLILEALRKSEAERRRAQVPDLLAEPQPAAPVALRPAPRWPLWAGAMVVVAGLGWLGIRDRAPAATPAVAVAAPVDDAKPIDTPASTTPTPAPAPPPRIQRPLVIAPPAPAPAATPATPATRVDAPVAVAVAATPAPPPRPLPSAAPASPVAHDDYVRITDLGSDERKALPALKLSMHMWNDVPAQRFVIVDGTRLVIGDRLGPLVVADIVSDGVLFDWNGRALKLPLR